MAESTILQVSPCYVDITGESGGVANIVRQICMGLVRRGRKVVLVCGGRELGAVRAPAGRYQPVKGLEVVVLEQRSHPLLGPSRSVRTTIEGLKDIGVAHVHTCFSALTEAAMAALARRSIPYVFTPHGKLSPEIFAHQRLAKSLWWRWRAKAAVHASVLTASSAAETALFASLGIPSPTATIPNGYDPSGLEAADAGTTRLIAEPYILFLGYLDPRKQPELLVRAFAASQARQSHRLVLAGPDSYGHLRVVQAAIDAAGVGDRVTVFGPAYGPTKWQLLKQAACFALPSKAEGLPVALCEALGAHLPLVISTGCNFGEAASAGAAIEVANFQVSAWAAALDQACLDPARHASLASASAKLAPRYTWDAVVDKWCQLYDDVKLP